VAELRHSATRSPSWCRDGDSVALEGFTHLIPFAAGHEVLRQGRRELELIRMTPDILYDQMIGMGAARKLVFSYGAIRASARCTASATRSSMAGRVRSSSRSIRTPGWRTATRGRGAAAVRGDARLRGHRSGAHTRVKPIACPFTGEQLVAVPALAPDVAIVHAQEADRDGNVQLWGIPGVQKEAVLAADRALVTVERIVERLEPARAAS
jgi:glutaconate CoA-transferase subunit A